MFRQKSLAGFVFISLRVSFDKMFLSSFMLQLSVQLPKLYFLSSPTNDQYKPFEEANKGIVQTEGVAISLLNIHFIIKLKQKKLNQDT